MRDSGGELLQYRLVIEPRAARRARHVVGSLLEGWRLGGLADDVVSCVSELVANGCARTAHPPIRPPTTISGRREMRCTSRRCSTGSFRTFAGSSAMTFSTSRRSSHNGGWHLIFTWLCGARSPAPSCAGCWPRPITRCGGPTPPSSASRTTRCPCGMSSRHLPRPGHRRSPADVGRGP